MFRRISLYKMFVGMCILIFAAYFTSIGFAQENQSEKSQSPMMESATPFDTALNLNEVDQSPKCIRKAKDCQYPCKAKLCSIEGCVTLMCVIDTKGKVKAAKVVEAKPEGYFEEAALATVKKYKFRPAKKGGKSVDCIVKIPIRYALNEY